MICHEVKYGKVGTNIAACGGAVLLQVEAGEGEAFQQARASLTYEQAEQLIRDLQARIQQAKETEARFAGYGQQDLPLES